MSATGHHLSCSAGCVGCLPNCHASAGGCLAGHGGSSCEQCKPGLYSTGGKPNNPRPPCRPCGPRFTSPPGAIAASYCECEAGFGFAGMGDYGSFHRCDVCPIGTYNPGPSTHPAASSVSIAAVAAIGSATHHVAMAVSPAQYGMYGAPQGYYYYGGAPQQQIPPRKRRMALATPCRYCNATNPEGGFITTDVGATSAEQCICAPGHGGARCDCCPRVREAFGHIRRAVMDGLLL